MTAGVRPFIARARVITLLIALPAVLPLPVLAADIPALITALRDPQPEKRAEARKALVKAGPEAVPALVEAIRSDSNRAVMTIILREIGPGAVPELIALLKSPKLRNRAGAALFQVIGPESLGQTPALLDCLRDPAVNNYCGTSLVKMMGPRAKGQIGKLLEALKDPNPTVRIYAIAALGRIKTKDKRVVDAFKRAAQDENLEVRRLAEEALSDD
jgi:HEAT repeat protein